MVVFVKLKLVVFFKLKVGERVLFNGIMVEVILVGVEIVDVLVNGVIKMFEVNGSVVVDLVVFEYNGKEIRVYVVDFVLEIVNLEYVVFYLYWKVRVFGFVDVLIIIISFSDVELNLKFGIFFLFFGWKVNFIYGGVEVGEILVLLKGMVSLIFYIELIGSGVVKFIVGNFIGSLEVESVGIEVLIFYLSLEVEVGISLSVLVVFVGMGRVEFIFGSVL